MRCIEYIAKNGNFLPYQEIASALGEEPQRVRAALGDARADGLLVFGKDDVTGQGGYSITSKGQARILNGNQTVNGKRAGENKAACDAKEAHVMSAPVDDGLVETVHRLMEENAALRKANFDMIGEVDHLRKRLDGSVISEKPIGYAHAWSYGIEIFNTEKDARADIEKLFSEGAQGTSYLCAILDTAELSVKWQRS